MDRESTRESTGEPPDTLSDDVLWCLVSKLPVCALALTPSRSVTRCSKSWRRGNQHPCERESTRCVVAALTSATVNPGRNEQLYGEKRNPFMRTHRRRSHFCDTRTMLNLLMPLLQVSLSKLLSVEIDACVPSACESAPPTRSNANGLLWKTDQYSSGPSPFCVLRWLHRAYCDTLRRFVCVSEPRCARHVTADTATTPRISCSKRRCETRVLPAHLLSSLMGM